MALIIEDNEKTLQNRHFRPEAMDERGTTCSNEGGSAAARLGGEIGALDWSLNPRSSNLVVCTGGGNGIKLVMAVGARDGLVHGLSSLQMDLTGGKTCNGKCWLVTVQNVDRLSMMLLTIQMIPMCDIPACAIGSQLSELFKLPLPIISCCPFQILKLKLTYS